jgi:hypothetical protein
MLKQPGQMTCVGTGTARAELKYSSFADDTDMCLLIH